MWHTNGYLNCQLGHGKKFNDAAKKPAKVFGRVKGTVKLKMSP